LNPNLGSFILNLEHGTLTTPFLGATSLKLGFFFAVRASKLYKDSSSIGVP
jgi:hypothetical protein